jgi:ABC-type multidrug transport system ATPase subunit
MTDAVALGRQSASRWRSQPSAGKVTGLVGPDGAGKTTLIRILAGLMAPSEGKSKCSGSTPGEQLDDLGYMPQRFGLYEDLSVIENLTLYAEVRGLPKAEHKESFDRLLDFTDLARFQDRLAGKLSGGMKQKLGLACALVKTPKVLLLDEPGVGVDPISRRELWAMVGDLTDQGIGVLWSTAYLDEAEKCDTVYLLNEGKLLFDGPPADLTGKVADRVFRVTGFKERRRHFLTRTLDRDEVIDGTIQGRSVRLLIAEGAAVPTPESLDAGGRRGRARTAALRGRLHRAAGRRPQGHQRPRGTLSRDSRERGMRHRGQGPHQGASAISSRQGYELPRSRAGRSSDCSAPTARASRPPSRCCAAC